SSTTRIFIAAIVRDDSMSGLRKGFYGREIVSLKAPAPLLSVTRIFRARWPQTVVEAEAFLPEAFASRVADGDMMSTPNVAFAKEVRRTLNRPSSGVFTTKERDFTAFETDPVRVSVEFFVHGALTSCWSSASALSSGKSSFVTMSQGASSRLRRRSF